MWVCVCAVLEAGDGERTGALHGNEMGMGIKSFKDGQKSFNIKT